MDKLKVFESFVSVATRGSLSAAARAEGVAPAIIGRRLDALESHLGVKLLLVGEEAGEEAVVEGHQFEGSVTVWMRSPLGLLFRPAPFSRPR